MSLKNILDCNKQNNYEISCRALCVDGVPIIKQSQEFLVGISPILTKSTNIIIPYLDQPVTIDGLVYDGAGTWLSNENMTLEVVLENALQSDLLGSFREFSLYVNAIGPYDAKKRRFVMSYVPSNTIFYACTSGTFDILANEIFYVNCAFDGSANLQLMGSDVLGVPTSRIRITRIK